MKFGLTAATACSLLFSIKNTVDAFTPPRPIMTTTTTTTCLYNTKSNQSLEDEVEELVQKEIAKTKRMSNLRNANGVEYAPWMNISAQDEEKIRSMMREKAEARRRRFEQTDVSGSLLRDSAFQELSGTGLKSKIIDGNAVELEWATGSEANTKGFIIKRRPVKTSEFTEIASYESFGPLASQGAQGGVYRYLDESVPPGGWVYRITECEANGSQSDLSQCLVEIQTQQERMATMIGVGVFGAAAVAAVAAGFLLDPMQ